MGVLNVSVDDEVEREFRELVRKRFGPMRGALGAAVTEALRLWIEKYSSESKL
jgi:hypothetical protein